MASYVVAASVFIIGSSYLLHFVVEPPGGGTAAMEHQTLRVNAQTALEVLLGTPGWPAAWDNDVTGIQRLGLIERGTSIRIDPDKFDALARGKFATASADGYIDYAEAKSALGIEGYDFHLRAYPVTSPNESAAYGLEGMTDFQVAYIGNWNSGAEQSSSVQERWALEALDLGFTNTTRSNTTVGDVYTDNSVDIRSNLLPVIGPTIQQTVLSAGAGTKYDFYRVNKSSYDPLADPQTLPAGPALTSALALSSDGATLGYTKNRELRAIIGEFAVSSNLGVIEWYEYVDTDRGNLSYDCGDYGFVEASYDSGVTWTRLTDTADDRSQDCNVGIGNAPGTTMTRRVTGFGCACTNALLAFHWIGDNDNNVGYGWVIDDVTVTSGGETRLRESFSAPEYDMVVIGSDVDHLALVPDDIKNGFRDYVDLYGGRLVVLGGDQNRQWLDRLFDAGTGGGSGGVATPDTTHPLLTLPNQLSFASYPSNQSWTFTEEEASLFSMVMGTTTTSQRLSVSRSGAWSTGGSADGAVILTSYEPHTWHFNETRMFFANAAIYGKFHYLFLEVGPQVPSGEAVASVSRSATMNKYRTGEANYTEMAFVMYLWPGETTAQTLATSAVTPTAPRSLSVTSTSSRAELSWWYPVSNGTTNITHFEVWRGNSPTTITGPPIATIARLADSQQKWMYFHNDTSVQDGTTYYYNVTAAKYNATTGAFESRGTPSAVNSTTPLALPGAPSLSATSQPGAVRLVWTDPGTSATGTTLGYRITAALDGQPYTTIADVGSVLTYDHAPGDTVARTYKVEALNARGYGTASTATALIAAQATTPVGAPTLLVARGSGATLSLSWLPPADLLGQTVQNWRIWRAETESGTYTHIWDAPAANSSFVDADLAPEATRYYKLQAITNVAPGANSTVQSQTTAGLATAPTLFATSNGTTGTISLSWGIPSDLKGGTLSGYKIWSSTDNFAWTQLYTGNALNVSYADAGLGNNASRYYRVQAVTDVGDGAYASTSSAVKTKGAPDTPTGVSANGVLGTTTVTWSAPWSESAITGYEVWRADAQAGTYTRVQEAWATSPYVEASSGKWFKIKAVSASGTSEFSAADQA